MQAGHLWLPIRRVLFDGCASSRAIRIVRISAQSFFEKLLGLLDGVVEVVSRVSNGFVAFRELAMPQRGCDQLQGASAAWMMRSSSDHVSPPFSSSTTGFVTSLTAISLSGFPQLILRLCR